MVDIPTLETARLRLRPHRSDDFEGYAALWGDPSVVRYIGGTPFTREQAWARLLRQTGHWHQLGFGFFAIEDKSTGGFAGEAGFQDLRRDMAPSIEGTMEAGWVLTPAMRGRGLAEEAMCAAIAWAGAHGTREQLSCIIDPDNTASLHIAEKLGFRRLAEADYHGPVVLLGRPRLIVGDGVERRELNGTETSDSADERGVGAALAPRAADPPPGRGGSRGVP